MKRHFEENPYAGKDLLFISHDFRYIATTLSDNLHFVDSRPEEVEKNREYAVMLASSAYEVIAVCEAVLASTPKDIRKEAKEEAEGYIRANCDPFEKIVSALR